MGLIALAALMTAVTLWLLVSLLRPAGKRRSLRGRQERRGRHHTEADPGEALALVGDALAATHDPRALLTIILEVVVDATSAQGGRVVEDGEEVSWIGETHGGHPPLMLELARNGESHTSLLLYPTGEGFAAETRELAEWLASQAAIALENARLHHLVQRQAITDDLTGLANRRRFIEALNSEITRSSTFGTPLSVIIADLDDFKLVNDLFGHHVGDEVLRRFAQLIEAHLREVDVPGRLGGEEFAILVPDTDAAGATAVAERIRGALGGMTLPLREARTITATFGVAQLEEGESGDELLRRADVALYHGKSRGKDMVAVEAARPS
jgi:diguanylate cyclase (GGDEF)-like protein